MIKIELKEILKSKSNINKGEIYIQFEFKEKEYIIDLTEIDISLLKYNLIGFDNRSIYKYIVPLWEIKNIKVNGGTEYDINNTIQHITA